MGTLADIPAAPASKRRFDPRTIRADFPILSLEAGGKPLVYLDNGATTQKPRAVLDALQRYYESENANIHRGVYHLSQLATQEYELARRKICRFINAADEREIIYTRGTTESINLVASSWGRLRLGKGDEVVISAMEHHSNIVPWQIACAQAGAALRVIPMNDRGELLLEEYEKLLKSGRVKMVSIVHISNSLGTVNDVKLMTSLAHAHGAVMMVDGAQHVAHHPTDVRDIGCDFYAFSGHKLFGPTGIGVLYGRQELLDAMPPYQGGGDMIASVTFEKTTYAGLPNKFEAGTPHIAGAVGLGAAIDYVSSIGLKNTSAHEAELLAHATQQMSDIPGLRLVGTAAHKASVVSFVIDGMAAHDVGVLLDMEGIAVRSGHHCCQPVMDRFGISATARASIAMYNTREEIDALAQALRKLTGRAPSRPHVEAQVKYPSASAPSPRAAADELIEMFDFLGDDPNAKSLFVMDDLGAKLPNLFDLLKKVTTRLDGCMSEVYFVGRRSSADPQVLEFVADANAAIVRGEIAMLQRIFSGQKASEILAFDVEAFFRRIGLERFLTSQRRTGMASMVNRIRRLAQDVVGAPSGT
jgi:cysteine desulfurase/selenocysteine lyase